MDCPENGEIIALLDLMCTILIYSMYLRSQRQLDICMMTHSDDMFVLYFTRVRSVLGCVFFLHLSIFMRHFSDDRCKFICSVPMNPCGQQSIV